LDFIKQDAKQDFPVSLYYQYTIQPRDDQFEILENNHSFTVGPDVSTLTYALLARIHGHVLKQANDCLTMHAGFAGYHSTPMVFIGDKGAGKTTLMSRLLLEGFQVYGDELVVMQNRKLFSFPRRFHIKATSTNLLPQFGLDTARITYVLMQNGTKLFAFSPSEADFDWQIKKLQADIFIFMHANHGEKSRIEACPKYRMVQKIMPRTFLIGAMEHMKIEKLCALIKRSMCYNLYMGDLKSAVAQLKKIVNETNRLKSI